MTHRHLSDHLSEVVENTLTDLEQSKVKAGLYTGFLPRGGELGVCKKRGGARLFIAAGQPQGVRDSRGGRE